jgi:hypothetical protein
MNSNSIKQQIIHHLAEEKVPVNYDPWVIMQEKIEANTSEKEIHSSGKFAAVKRRNLAALAIFGFVLIVAVFFMTPPGQVIANGLLSFFFRTDSNVRALPTEPINPETTTYGLNINEAENLAGFKILVPASLPEGYSLAEVIYDSQLRETIQVYKFEPYQAGEMFLLTQQTSQPAEIVGQSAEVKEFIVGTTSVESVLGSWFAPLNSTTEEWSSDAPVHTFRWQEDDFFYSIQFWVNDSFSPAYLSVEDRTAFLETLIGTRSAFPEKINLNNLLSQDEIIAASGMQILMPTVLPDGFQFSHAVYEPENKRVVLIYPFENGNQGSDQAKIVIFETPINSSQGTVSFDGYPEGAVERLTIGDVESTYIHGALMDGKYDENFGSGILEQTNSLNISIQFYGSATVSLDKASLIEVAKSLK